MKRFVLLALVLALALTIASSAVAGGKARTTVTLDSIQPTPTETLYAGDISSPRKACKNKRRVFVYRVRDGADEKIGATRSFKGEAQPGYFWTLAKDGLPDAGDYYAKVKPTDVCKGDRSANFSYPL